MAENGYDALAALGQGAYLLLKINNPDLSPEGLGRIGNDGRRVVSGGTDLTAAEWIPIAQITGDLNITLETTEHDVTGADEIWARFEPGHNRVSNLSIPIWFNPDLLTQSWGNSVLDQKASLFYAYRNRQIRDWRIFTQQANYRGRASADFKAFIRQLPLNIPDSGLMRMTLNLRVTGPFSFNADRSSEQRIILDHTLTGGT